MYVNTLITLQENLTTYAVDGKKVTGHVTINSPGMIKCYIQNLKGQESESITYSFYAFSKVINKAVRIGNLSKHKETRWLVDENNVEGSGIKLEELDAVAVVMENRMRGADTVAMGFKNNRYMIIPLIDEVIKKLPYMKDKQADKNESNKEGQSIDKKVEKSSIQNIDSEKKQKSYAVTKENNHIVKPDTIHEGSNPIGIIKNTLDSSGMKLSSHESSISPGGSMVSQSGNMNTQGNMSQSGNMNTQGNMSQSGSMNVQGNVSQSGSMNVQGNVPQGGNMDTQMDMINNEADEKMSADDLEPGPGTDTIIDDTQPQGNVSSQGNDNNTVPEMQGIEESDFTKEQIRVENEFGEITPTENLSDEEAQLKKIAEKLQEAEQEPAIKKAEKLDILFASTNIPSASVVRDEEDPIDEALQKTSEELRSIIERLNGDMQIKDKIESIERQIEKISEFSRGQKFADKPKLEQTLEKQYLDKQDQMDNEKRNIVGINEENEIEDVTQQVQEDTSPKSALTFIKGIMEKFSSEKLQEKEYEKKPLLSGQRSIQEEVDYISEIDKKIREIEERRKMGKE